MADFFISYASSDVEIAEQLATALGGRGWSVFWDRKVPPGQRWADVLERELDAAKCVVVLWSEASVASRWVKVEASEALEMEKLVPARIEKVRPPLGYRDIEAADLREWTPGSPGAEYDQLVDAVSGLVEESTGESVSGVAEPALAPPQLWDPGTVIEVRTLEGHADKVWAVAVTPDGRHIVSGSKDETVKVWDLASGDKVRTLEGHTDQVWGVAVTPDGRHIVSGSDDRTVKVWDLTTKSQLPEH